MRTSSKWFVGFFVGLGALILSMVPNFGGKGKINPTYEVGLSVSPSASEPKVDPLPKEHAGTWVADVPVLRKREFAAEAGELIIVDEGGQPNFGAIRKLVNSETKARSVCELVTARLNEYQRLLAKKNQMLPKLDVGSKVRVSGILTSQHSEILTALSQLLNEICNNEESAVVAARFAEFAIRYTHSWDIEVSKASYVTIVGGGAHVPVIYTVVESDARGNRSTTVWTDGPGPLLGPVIKVEPFRLSTLEEVRSLRKTGETGVK